MNKAASLLCLLVALFCTSFLQGQISLPSGVPVNADIILWLSPDTALYRGNGSVATVGRRVDKWHDISGSGFIFDAPLNTNRPRLVNINGFNYLDFTQGDFLENILIKDSINSLTEFSIFIVIKSDETTTDNGFLDTEDPNGTDDKICLRYDANGANTGRVNLLKSGLGGNTPNQQVETQNNTQTTDRQVLTITWSINNSLKVYIDGTLNDTSRNPITTALSGINKVIIGKGPKDVNATDGWEGKIGSVIFFKKEFNADTINSISQTIQTVKSIQSGSWNTASTWDCNCIPNPSNNVEITSGHTVNLSTTVSIDNLYIGPTATLNAGSNSLNVNLDGDWNNFGSFIPGNSTVHFRNGSNQQIKGNTTFSNLRLNNTSSLTIASGATSLNGTLTLSSGVFNTNGRLTLNSSASGSARVAAISAGTVNGDVTVQRYIDAGGTNWRFLSSPVSNISLASWKDDFVTSGFPGSDFPTFPFISVYSYDETVSGDRTRGYTAPTNISNIIATGKGYSVWCGDTINGTQPFTVDMTGPLNSGTLSLPVSYTLAPLQPFAENGWNLVGNPYPSAIDWNSASWTKTNIANAIYIWNPDLAQYSSFVNGLSTNGGSRYIASSQAFWVQATTLFPQLTLNENVKSVQNPVFLRQKAPSPYLRIELTGMAAKDETIVVIENQASDNFDYKYDARKLHSNQAGAPSLYTEIKGEEYAINAINNLQIDQVIPLFTKVKATGNYQLNFTNQFGNEVNCLYLEDRLLNLFTDISRDTNYAAFISDTTRSARFYIHFGAPLLSKIRNPECTNDSSGEIIAIGKGKGPWTYTWKNFDERVLRKVLNSPTSDTLDAIPNGTYSIEIENDGICFTSQKTISLKSNSMLTSDFNFQRAGDSSTIIFTNLSNHYQKLNWDFGDGHSSIEINPRHTYQNSGNYKVRLTAIDSNNCKISSNGEITVNTLFAQNPSMTLTAITVSPNPSSGLFKLSQPADIEIKNLLGKSLLQQQNTSTFYIGDFSKGVYLLIINGREAIKIERL